MTKPPTNREMLDLLRRVGQALYGDEWITPLANDLINPQTGEPTAVRTVRRWNSEVIDVPPHVAAEMIALVRRRGPEVSADLRRRLAEIAALSKK